MVPPARGRSRRDDAPAPTPELVIAGRAWLRGRLQPVEIGIDGDGRICAVARTLEGARRHDVGQRVVVPAATDPHVHFRDPGPDGAAESIATGTVGAALGGVGLVGEMPNTEPPVTSVDRLEAKAERVRGRAAVDVLLFATPPSPRSVRALARRAGGLKLFLSPTTGIASVPPGEELSALLDAVGEVDLPLVAHAEEPALFRHDPQPSDPAGWDAARPTAAEAAAVARLLAGPTRLRLHVAHVTSAAIGRTLRAAGLSFEATPHHLLLSTTSGRTARFKVNPPLRSPAERVALWEAFRSGEVPMLGSDHAPHAAESKALPFELAPSGVPGVQTAFPLLLAQVAAGELALPVLQQAACDRPARMFGQPCGRIGVGHRANLLVVDFRSRSPVRGERLASPCGWSPFEGTEAVFPVEHWRDGEPIVEGGEYVGRPAGRVVRPEYAPGESARPPADA